MTTTNVYQGLGDGSRASSKVLKPPGGGSSNIFGDPEPPRARPQQQPQQGTTNVLGQPLGHGGSYSGGQQAAPADVAYGGYDHDQNNAALPAGLPASGPPQDMGRSSGKKQGQDSFNNIFGGESQQQGGQRGRRKGDGAYNPITGEDYEQSPQAQRNASRVTNPPGGKSTGLW